MKNDEIDWEKLYKEEHDRYEEMCKAEQMRLKQLASWYGALPDGDEKQFEKLEEIFPELRESEEERIKTNIIKLLGFVRDTHHQYSDECNEAIDWLKKQGENKPIEEKVESVYTVYKVGDFVHCTTVNGFEYTYIYERNHGAIIHAFAKYSYATSELVFNDDTLDEPIISTKRKATKEEIDTLLQAIHKQGYEWDAENKVLRKIEQKPANKPEPTFNVGD